MRRDPAAVDDPLPTRWSLIERIKNPQDHESWNLFAQRYSGLIRGVSLRTGLTETEADEVVQNTLLSVHQKIDNFKADPQVGSFKGWLLRLTQWRIADQFRKRSQHPSLTRDPQSEDASRTSTAEKVPDSRCEFEALWETEWKQNLLELALQQVKAEVDPEQFQIFDFSALRHWPVARVARVMQVSAARVYVARHRVAKVLKKKIQRVSEEMV